MEEKPLDDITRKLLDESEGSPPFPREEVRMRIRDTIRRRESTHDEPRSTRVWAWTGRVAAAVAASLLVFMLGAEYGRRSAVGPSHPEVAAAPTPIRAAQDIPATIQARGTEYVAAVTRFSELAGSLSPFEREQARQVALAVLYGAALELLEAAPNDPVAGSVYESISNERDSGRRVAEPETHWF